MQADKKFALLLILLLLASLLSGCQAPEGPVEIVLPHNSAKTKKSGSVEKRFQESAAKSQTAAESAVELSEKYAELSEQAAVLRQEKQRLSDENNKLKDQLDACQAQLQQAQNELTQANDLLIEMRIELNNWKTDILGFRGEMRDAEKAQLAALLKILEVLGGEVKQQPAQTQNTPSDAASTVQSGQTQQMETPTLGKDNE